MIKSIAAVLILSSMPPLQDPPKRVLVKSLWVETSLDVWEELRQVDSSFKALGDDVARVARGLESEEIEARSKAAAELKALGLTAYGPIKAARDKASSDALRADLDAVLKSMVGDMEKSLSSIPGARRIGAREVESLKARLHEKRVPLQRPVMSLVDGRAASIFIGDMRAGHQVRKITIDGSGSAARLDEQGPLMKTGITIKIVPKIDFARGTATLEITATSRGLVGADTAEVTVQLTPELDAKAGFLAGPFPAVEEKGAPSWILIEPVIITP